MKRLVLISALAIALSHMTALAQQPQPAALPAWDQLSDAQREQLTAPTRERWNNASESDRARMMARAQRWQTMSPEQRHRANRGMKRWEGMPPEQQAHARALFHAMRDMDKAERKGFLDKWHAMTPEQRRIWLKEHPAPERHGSRDGHKPRPD